MKNKSVSHIVSFQNQLFFFFKIHKNFNIYLMDPLKNVTFILLTFPDLRAFNVRGYLFQMFNFTLNYL